jgi:hypothetical protein
MYNKNSNSNKEKAEKKTVIVADHAVVAAHLYRPPNGTQ